MVTIQTFQELAHSFAGNNRGTSFEKTSFRIKKKIFATYDGVNDRACIKLSAIDQDIYSKIDATIIYPVPNKWGACRAGQPDRNKSRKTDF